MLLRRRAERCQHVAPQFNGGGFAAPTAASDALKLLTFNIQVGIQARGFHSYLTNGWKHVLPHDARAANLRKIAGIVAGYDVVALQEIDAGSLRSAFINQLEYLADVAGFPYWYMQTNRDLGPLAQHGNGVLSRVAPTMMQDHKLPGRIPGRGAITMRVPFGNETVLLVMLHLSLGERSRVQQLSYVRGLIDGERNVVVMGDLNSHLSSLLFNSPLANTDLRPAPATQPTYPAWRPAVALDHVLVSPTLGIRDYEVLDCDVSDHRPIAVSLTRVSSGETEPRALQA